MCIDDYSVRLFALEPDTETLAQGAVLGAMENVRVFAIGL